METFISILSQPPSKDIVLWVVLIENVGILIYLSRQWVRRWRLATFSKKQKQY